MNKSHQPMPISIQVFDSVGFGIFVLLFLIGLSSLGGYNRTLKGADIEMLFPTPISPKVILAARMIRDVTGALMFQLFFLMYLAVMVVMVGVHGGGQNSLLPLYLGGMMGWTIMSVTVSLWGYVYNLYLTADSDGSRTSKRIVMLLLWGYILGIVAFVGLSFYSLRDHLPSLGKLGQSSFLRVVCFPGTFALWIARIFSGHVALGVVGIVGLICLSTISIMLSFRRLDWFYDIAAGRGVSQLNQRKLFIRSGFDGYAQERARSGKLLVKSKSRFAGLRVQGAKSLIWRELVMLPRRMGLPIYIFLVLGIFYGLLPLLLTMSDPKAIPPELIAAMIIGGGSMGLFIFSQSQVQGSGLQFLQFGDLLKALPFSSRSLMFWEIASRSILPLILIPITCIIGSIVMPAVAGTEASAFVFLVPLTLVFMSVGTVSVVLFPDIGDPTQRTLRGLLILLGSVLGAAPGTGISLLLYFGLSAFHLPPIFLPLLIGGAVHLGVSFLISLYAGSLYNDFVPSE